MKAPTALIVAAILALVLNQAAIASTVTGKPYPPDASSHLFPDSSDGVAYEDDSAEGASKVRNPKKRCGSKDKDCANEE